MNRLNVGDAARSTRFIPSSRRRLHSAPFSRRTTPSNHPCATAPPSFCSLSAGRCWVDAPKGAEIPCAADKTSSRRRMWRVPCGIVAVLVLRTRSPAGTGIAELLSSPSPNAPHCPIESRCCRGARGPRRIQTEEKLWDIEGFRSSSCQARPPRVPLMVPTLVPRRISDGHEPASASCSSIPRAAC